MKTIGARNKTGEALLTLTGTLLALVMFRQFSLSQIEWAVYLTIGAAYLTAQVKLFPDLWRSRTGSLVQAFCLLAFAWLIAVVGLTVAVIQRH